MRHYKKYLLGFGVTAVCLYIFIQQVKVSEVIDALMDFKWPYLGMGLISLFVGYALRISRWNIMLSYSGNNSTFKKCSAPFLGSIAINNLLPLRLGDVFRALIFPDSMGVPKTIAATSIVLERVIDLLTLLAYLALGVYSIEKIKVPTKLVETSTIVAAVCVGVLFFCLLFSRTLGDYFERLEKNSANWLGLKKIYGLFGRTLKGLRTMCRPKALLLLLGISLLLWGGEAGLFYFISAGLGMESTPIGALLVMSIATLSTLLPSTPGYVGTFHLAAYTAITLIGGTPQQAGSFAVIVHLALWVPTTLAGIVAIIFSPSLFFGAKSLIGKLETI